MDKATLVGIDIALGADVMNAMDRADISPNVVLWAYLDAYDDSRLIVAARTLDVLRLNVAYLRVNSAMDVAGISAFQAPSTLILATTDPFIRELRQLFAKVKDMKGMRLGHQTIGQYFVEAGYVYRIS